MTTTETDPQPADADQPEDTAAKRTRRAEPINTHTAKNGTVTYWFQLDLGTKPDGSRDRRKFTYRTKTEARKELRRISSEVAAGTYNRPTDITVSQACEAWLAGRRGIRRVTVYGYDMDLRPVVRHLGGRKLQQLTKAEVDGLVAWMLTEARTDHRHYRADSLAGRVVALVAEHPDGITAAELCAALPGDVHTALSALLRAGRVARLQRGVYAPTQPETAAAAAEKRGLAPQTVRSTLTTLGMVVQSYVDQGVLARNVVALVDRPKDRDADDADGQDDDSDAERAWSLAEAETFRAAVADDRLFGLWLCSLYGMRRSEVVGLRWSAINLDTGMLSVRRGRVVVGGQAVEGDPKSKRSRRNLPLPADVVAALRALKTAQKREAMALGVRWSDDRLVAVREDGTPVRPEWYSDTFQRLRERAGLRHITLHELRHTSVSLMFDRGVAPHVVAAWHGHSPEVALRIYTHVKAAELQAAGSALFG
ncbi:site-specific integrase [Mycobacterium sp. 852014-52450_SCH5900713]|uniref:site-specific integrase n=1 Tax=Mycobacterium sp. 852014-52450_SCH5900713 TaxID=1834116 RepID=UPI000AEB8159|nr:site-specific integrase [Mycobacterium sp. 852014-52450_SCH5900713]